MYPPARRVPKSWIAWSAIVGLACTDLPLELPRDGPIDLAAPWVVVSPERVGIEAASLSAAGDMASQIARMRSLLVVRGGRLAYERYFGGWAADTLADARSVTKSVVSTLVGIALAEGHIENLDQPITDFLSSPEYSLSAEHSDVSVRHLLTMTGGFDWNEINAPGYSDWILSGDHTRYILDRPFSDPPGSAFRYNSAAVHLLGVVVANAVGRPLPAYADDVLFGPMGVSERRWEMLSGGDVNGGAGLDLRPRDLARFGQLHLQEGWSGSQSLVPESWTSDATALRIPGLSGVGPITTTAYGFLWWLDTERSAFFAWGFAGQFVYVVPHLDLVVVTTTDWRGVSGDVGHRALQAAVMEILVRQILPAVS